MLLQNITDSNIAKLYNSKTPEQWLSIASAHPYFIPAQLFANFSTDKAPAADQTLNQRVEINVTNFYLLKALFTASVTNHTADLMADMEGNTEQLATKSEIDAEKTAVSEIKVPDEALVIEKEPMVFEPLFASDYFASQGIKLSEVVQPGDKLGNQLKSFTQWLQTMKKIQNTTTQDAADAPDSAVQQLANKSNIENEIITEAMALAYLQQNKTAKAIAVYEKLSLQYPGKSDYFAAEIKGLLA